MPTFQKTVIAKYASSVITFVSMRFFADKESDLLKTA